MPVRAASNSTVAVLVAKFTCALLTPSSEPSCRSMVRAHAAQDMPPTGRSTRSSCVATLIAPALRIPTARMAPASAGTLVRPGIVLDRCARARQVNRGF